MKTIKIFGLATMAAIGSMAFIGTGVASAESTQLCSVPTVPCPAGNVISHVHLLDPLEIFETPVITTHCHSLFLGDSLGLGNPLVIHGGYTYTSCTKGCTVTEVSSSSLIEILREGAGSTTLSNTTVQLHCSEIVNCTYAGGAVKGTVMSASLPTTAGKAVFTKQPLLKTGGLFCPKEGLLTTSLESLTDLFLST